jgi:glycosyltransferase involved in cell wall biosynthesis
MSMRLSIITPTIDSAVYIDEAIAGPLAVTRAELEHIVVHDGSPEYASRLAAKYPHLKILAGPGKGPTPAIAAGLAAATGDFIGYVSSDDRLIASAIDTFCKRAQERPQIRIWTGGARIFLHGPDDREFTVRLLTSPETTVASLANVLDDMPLVNARFIHRSVYAQLGNLDLRFPESSDREFMIRVAMSHIPEAFFDAVVSEQRQHESSRTIHNKRSVVPPYLSEHLRIAEMWLSREDAPVGARRFFRRWRARETLRLAVAQLRAGFIGLAMTTVLRESLRDPLFPVWAPSSLAAWRRRRRNGMARP